MWKLGKYASYGEWQYSTHFFLLCCEMGCRQEAKKGSTHIFLLNPIIIFEYSTQKENFKPNRKESKIH